MLSIIFTSVISQLLITLNFTKCWNGALIFHKYKYINSRVRLCLLEIQDLTTKWGEFAVPYIPFDWGGIWGGISPSFPRDPFHTPFIWAGFLPIVQCDPNIICLLIITLGIFIWVALYHMWIRARTSTAPKVAPLCSKVQNVSEFEGGDF